MFKGKNKLIHSKHANDNIEQKSLKGAFLECPHLLFLKHLKFEQLFTFKHLCVILITGVFHQ